MPHITLTGSNLNLSNMSETVAKAVSNLKHPDGHETLVSRYKDAIRAIPDGVMAAIYEKNPELALQWIALSAFHDFKIDVYDSTEESIAFAMQKIQEKVRLLPPKTQPLLQQQMAAMKKVIEHGDFYAAVAAPQYFRNLFGALKMFIPQTHSDQQVHFKTPANLQLKLMRDKQTNKDYLVATLTIKQIPGEKPFLTHDNFEGNAVIAAFDNPDNEISFQFAFDLSETAPQAQLREIKYAGTDKWCDAIDIVLQHSELFNFTDQHVKSTSGIDTGAQAGGLYQHFPNSEIILANYHNLYSRGNKQKNSATNATILRNLFLESNMQAALNLVHTPKLTGSILDVRRLEGTLPAATVTALSAELQAAKDLLHGVTAPFTQRIDNVESKMKSSVVGWMHPHTEKKDTKLLTMKQVVLEIQEKYEQYIEDVIALAEKHRDTDPTGQYLALMQEMKNARIMLLTEIDEILHRPALEDTLKEPRHMNLLETKSASALKSAQSITEAGLTALDNASSRRTSTSSSNLSS